MAKVKMVSKKCTDGRRDFLGTDNQWRPPIEHFQYLQEVLRAASDRTQPSYDEDYARRVQEMNDEFVIWLEENDREAKVTTVASLGARVEIAERDSAELREEHSRALKLVAALRKDLEQTRIRCGQLERQIQGYDEDTFDPGKQKGMGGIPVGGPDLAEVEFIENRLGMSPTLDQQLRALGMESTSEQTQYLLKEREEQSEHERELKRVLQVLWKCRAVLVAADTLEDLQSVEEAVDAIDALPIALFERHLDIKGWDEETADLPDIRKS